MPLRRYTERIAAMMNRRSPCAINTSSMINLIRYASAVLAAPYTTMASAAPAMTARCGVAYRSRRRKASISDRCKSPYITPWMHRMPLPRMPDDDLKVGVLRPPPQLTLRAVTGCIEYRRISRTARRRLPGHRVADHLPDRLDHRLHRVRRAGADVEGAGGSATVERREGPDVRRGQIADVDVIAQAGAVGRRIVLAEDLER